MSVVRGRIPARFLGGPMDGKVVRGVSARHFVAWDMSDGPVDVYTRTGEVYGPFDFVTQTPGAIEELLYSHDPVETERARRHRMPEEWQQFVDRAFEERK